MTTSQISRTLENMIERINAGTMVTTNEVETVTAAFEVANWGGRLGQFGDSLQDRIDLINSKLN